MGADIIQAQYDQLATVAQRFGTQADACAALQQQLIGRLQPLEQGGWQGRGRNAFLAEMNSTVLPAMQRLIAALQGGQRTTIQISDIMRAAEEEASRPFRGAAAGVAGALLGGMSAAQIADALIDVDEDGGVLGFFGDVLGGAWSELGDMVSGLGNLVFHPIDTIQGLWYGVTHPGALWDALTKPFVEDWENGHPGRAIGRGIVFIGSIFVGTKGAEKLLKGGRIGAVVGETGEIASGAGKAGELGRLGEAGEAGGRLGRLGEAGEAGGAAGRVGEAGATAGRLINTTGRVLSAEEAAVANMLVGEGRVVEIVAEGVTRTPDFLVNGVRTELKTITNVTSQDVSGAVARRVLDGAGQAPHILLDTRGQAGFTRELAERAARRAYGADKLGRLQQIRIVGDGFDITIPRLP